MAEVIWDTWDYPHNSVHDTYFMSIKICIAVVGLCVDRGTQFA